MTTVRSMDGALRTDSGDPSRRWPVAGLVLFACGLALFGALSVVSRQFENETEQRLLTRQTEQAGTLLTLSVDQVRAPLAAAARSAQATTGSTDVFTTLMAPTVGDGQSYARVALLARDSPEPVALVGDGPLLLDDAVLADLLAGEPAPMRVVDLLDSGRVLGYAVSDEAAPGWMVYAERNLSPDPTVRRRTEEPFSDLNYAIYLGPGEADERLLGASTADLPLRGRRADVTVPFGDQQIELVTTPRGRLGSAELQALWWVVLGGGVAASAAVAWLLERTIASRRSAQRLAALTETLYNDQRDTAEALQRSLLPELARLPPDTEVAARYWPAGTAQLIGGDFYDVFPIDDHRWGILIGDVCGKGVEAAGLTGLARYSVQAAAQYCSQPSDMLRAMHRVLREQRVTTFCTACLVVFDADPSAGGQALVSLAGHPAPLLRRADGEVVHVGRHGSILGWFEPELGDDRVDLAPGDLLVLYTDGLTDAPGDQGVPIVEVEQLLRARGAVAPVGELADEIRVLKRRRRPHGSSDDTVLVCIRFVGSADGPTCSDQPLSTTR